MPDLNVNIDGANFQAQAVLAMVRYLHGDGIESSRNEHWKSYDATPKVDRWHNCREQGYIIHMINSSRDKQINIVFFEHRNSDLIHVFKWICSPTINPPTIESIPEGVYKNKNDTDFNCTSKQIYIAAVYINEELKLFWKNE